MQTEESSIPKCPACHVGCRLDRWQCGRGRDMAAKWEAGEEIPARGAGGPGGPAGGPGGPGGGPGAGGRMPVQQRIVRGVNILPKALSRCVGEPERDTALTALMRRNGVMATGLIAHELGCGAERAESIADELVADGLATRIAGSGGDTSGNGGNFLEVSAEGEERAQRALALRKERHAAFLGCLSESEQEELADMLDRILEANRPAAMR